MGYYFDPTETVFAGEDAITFQCPPGLAGNATRRCTWNGPDSASGTWAEPTNNCHRMRWRAGLDGCRVQVCLSYAGSLTVNGARFTSLSAVYCEEEISFNAVFPKVLIGKSAGQCRAGYSGSIERLCMYNSTTGEAYWGAPIGSCKRTCGSRLLVCEMRSFSRANRLGMQFWLWWMSSNHLPGRHV